MKKLFLDDIRTPPSDDYVLVMSFDEFVSYIETNGCPRNISFDHDLGTKDDLTGMDCIKFLVNKDMEQEGKLIPMDFTFSIHSANPVGRENMDSYLLNYLKMKREEN